MAYYRKKPSLIKRMVRALGLIMILGGVAASLGVWRLNRWAETPIEISAPTQVEFSRGTSLLALSQLLNDYQAIDHPTYFHLWVKLFSNYSRFQAGLYKFEGPTSPKQIAEVIISGKIFEPIVLQYTIPEGFNTKLIAKRLAANGVGDEQHILALFKNQQFLKSLKIPGATLEGFFYPATYQFVRTVTPQEAIRHAVETFWNKLPVGYEEAVQSKGLSLLEAVTFASLIEVETKHNDEKPKIAEVIWRRLKNREPIGIDAAIIYGIKDYRGDIKVQHLRDASNPYNNRLFKGLPPTPISSPAVSSLEAVLNPTNEGYYYYVYDVETIDRHHFSKTLAEHNQYVKKLVSATSRNRR